MESLVIRRADAGDHGEILALLQALDLGYSALDLSCFWVAESDGLVAGVAELKEGEAFFLLSCVGVRENLQGTGIGRALVDRISRQTRAPVYLYTVVPEFFRKVGFRDATPLPRDLPPRSMYGCSECTPALCRCLMRPPDGS